MITPTMGIVGTKEMVLALLHVQFVSKLWLKTWYYINEFVSLRWKHCDLCLDERWASIQILGEENFGFSEWWNYINELWLKWLRPVKTSSRKLFQTLHKAFTNQPLFQAWETGHSWCKTQSFKWEKGDEGTVLKGDILLEFEEISSCTWKPASKSWRRTLCDAFKELISGNILKNSLIAPSNYVTTSYWKTSYVITMI